MKYREVVIFSGHRFQVPEHIQRLDTRNTRAWQLRYGKWKTFSDHTADGSGAAAALAAAIEELRRRIERLPAPTGLRQENSSSKTTIFRLASPAQLHEQGKGGALPNTISASPSPGLVTSRPTRTCISVPRTRLPTKDTKKLLQGQSISGRKPKRHIKLLQPKQSEPTCR